MDETFDTGVALEDIDPARPRALETPWGAFSLFRVGERVLCVQSFCPHLGGPLFQGSLWGENVTCPWHRWSFALATGARVDLAGRLCGRESLATCEVGLSERGTVVLRKPERRLRA